jgi:hypothetical protein
MLGFRTAILVQDLYKLLFADHPLRIVSGTIHDTTTGSAADRIKRGAGM